MPIPLPELLDAARALGRELAPPEAQGLARYLELLSLWNRRMNLVGAKDWPAMLALVQDSWHLADLLRDWGGPVDLTLDLGAGAGLPGIPLRLAWDAGRYVLVEPRLKRAVFLRQAVAQLELPRTEVAACRLEDLPPALCRADLVMARAFLPPPALLEAAPRVLRPGGALVLMTRDLPPLPAGYALVAQQRYTARGAAQGLFLVAWRGREGGDLG